MAHCAGCEKPISYLGYWTSLVANFAKNATERLRFSPIVTCDACGQDNVQPNLGAALQLTTAAGALLAVAAIGGHAVSGPRGMPLLLAVLLLVELAWWRFIARLEPAADHPRDPRRRSSDH